MRVAAHITRLGNQWGRGASHCITIALLPYYSVFRTVSHLPRTYYTSMYVEECFLVVHPFYRPITQRWPKVCRAKETRERAKPGGMVPVGTRGPAPRRSLHQHDLRQGPTLLSRPRLWFYQSTLVLGDYVYYHAYLPRLPRRRRAII